MTIAATNPVTLVDTAAAEKARASVRGDKARATAELDTATRELRGILDQLPDGDLNFGAIQSIAGSGGEAVQKIIELHSAIAGYSDAVNEVRAVERLRDQPDIGAAPAAPHYGDTGARGTIVDQLRTHAAATGQRVGAGRSGEISVEMTPEVMAAVFKTTAGWPPESIRVPGLAIDSTARPVQVLDLFGTPLETTQNSVKYMRETTLTNSAVEKAEGTALGESALALSEIDLPVRKIGTIVPVTSEQLEDVAFVESYLQRRVPFLVRQRLDGQIVIGSGTAPDIKGLTHSDHSSDIDSLETSKVIVDPIADILRAKEKIRVDTFGMNMASAIIIAPAKWTDIQLKKDTTGNYYLGNVGPGWEARMWGLPVVDCGVLPDTTGKAWAMVGDFAGGADLVIRRDMLLEWGLQGADFARDAVSLRATMRATLLVYRDGAFCVNKRA